MVINDRRFDYEWNERPLSAQREKMRGEKGLVTWTRPLVPNDAGLYPYGVIQLKVDMVVSKTADSAFLSNNGGGVGRLAGLTECRMKVRLMQALLRTVEYATQS